jgi:hypothetical protein
MCLTVVILCFRFGSLDNWLQWLSLSTVVSQLMHTYRIWQTVPANSIYDCVSRVCHMSIFKSCDVNPHNLSQSM